MSNEKSQPDNPIKTRGHRFEVGGGKVMCAGKSHWPDFMRLEIPRAQAMTFALDILRQLEKPPFAEADPFVSVPVFGSLERVTEDDSTS